MAFQKQYYQELVELVKTEFAWPRQWCDGQECESYQNLVKVTEREWPGNNREKWFRTDEKSFEKELSKMYDQVLRNRQKILDQINKDVEYVISTNEISRNEISIIKSYSKPTRKKIKYVDNSRKAGFYSEDSYSKIKTAFNKMFSNVTTNTKAPVDTAKIKTVYMKMMGDTAKKRWITIENLIKDQNNYMKNSAKKLYMNRNDRLTVFYENWLEAVGGPTDLTVGDLW